MPAFDFVPLQPRIIFKQNSLELFVTLFCFYVKSFIFEFLRGEQTLRVAMLWYDEVRGKLFSEGTKSSCHYGLVTIATHTIISFPPVIVSLVKSVSSHPLGSVLNEYTHTHTRTHTHTHACAATTHTHKHRSAECEVTNLALLTHTYKHCCSLWEI